MPKDNDRNPYNLPLQHPRQIIDKLSTDINKVATEILGELVEEQIEKDYLLAMSRFKDKDGNIDYSKFEATPTVEDMLGCTMSGRPVEPKTMVGKLKSKPNKKVQMSKKFKFLGTKAPWTYSTQKGVPGHCFSAQVFDPNGNNLAILESTVEEKVASANALLMSKAPDMFNQLKVALKVLKELRKEYDIDEVQLDDTIKDIKILLKRTTNVK